MCRGNSSENKSSVLITKAEDQCSANQHGKSEQLKATKVWNEIVVCFNEGMYLRNNQKQKQTLENCFSGKEAVQWLHSYLQFRQSPTIVNKEQAVMLLTKLAESNVLICVHMNNEKKVNDSKNMYRFHKLFNHTPNKASNFGNRISCKKAMQCVLL